MNPESRLLHLPLVSRYAISAAMRLASLPDGEYEMVEVIAGKSGLPSSYLSKILQRLAKLGLLESRRGACGGYRLSRPACEITLAELIAAASPLDKSPVPCMIEARACDQSKPCGMHETVKRTESRLRRRLEGVTLAASLAEPDRMTGEPE